MDARLGALARLGAQDSIISFLYSSQRVCPYLSMDWVASGELHPAVVEWWLKQFLPIDCKRCVLLLAGVPITMASSLMKQMNCTPSVVLVAPRGADLEIVKSDWTKDMKDRVPLSVDIMTDCADACGKGLPLWVVTESADNSEIRDQLAASVLQTRMDEMLRDPLETAAEPAPTAPPEPSPAKKGRKKRSASRSPSPPKKSPKKHTKTPKQKKSKKDSSSGSDLTSEEEDTKVTRATSSKTPVKKTTDKSTPESTGKAASAMQKRLGQAYMGSKEKSKSSK